ncbi:hypothetical protein [Pseudomonas serboccidentalis]|uniref:hypothetical protein n=1 Tax=Pseudomonas serboccidentalis TaxID=2964670 RepID=UPI0039E0F783
MDITSIPPTMFVAFGVITAALLTGFFSTMNMVSTKENKVSEFRLGWIDGLRNEIAEYTSAAQELFRANNPNKFSGEQFHSDKEKHELEIQFYKETKATYARAVENLSKIQLRLNPAHIKEKPEGAEAKLMLAVSKARKLQNKDFKEVLECCEEIRTAAAPILKSTWDSVKRGEPAYRLIRISSLITVFIGFYAVIIFSIYIGLNTYKNEKNKVIENAAQHLITPPIKSSESNKHPPMSVPAEQN